MDCIMENNTIIDENEVLENYQILQNLAGNLHQNILAFISQARVQGLTMEKNSLGSDLSGVCDNIVVNRERHNIRGLVQRWKHQASEKEDKPNKKPQVSTHSEVFHLRKGMQGEIYDALSLPNSSSGMPQEGSLGKSRSRTQIFKMHSPHMTALGAHSKSVEVKGLHQRIVSPDVQSDTNKPPGSTRCATSVHNINLTEHHKQPMDNMDFSFNDKRNFTAQTLNALHAPNIVAELESPSMVSDDDGGKENERRTATHGYGFMLYTGSPYNRKVGQKLVVMVSVVFLNISWIDTVKETYKADVFIQARWREPDFDDRNIDSDDVKWGELWLPELYINNITDDNEDIMQHVWRAVEYKRSKAFVVERRRIRANFIENMELNDYPFDQQKLTVTLASDHDPSELTLEVDRYHPCEVHPEIFLSDQEWVLHRFVHTRKHKLCKDYEPGRAHQRALTVSCFISRNPRYFIINLMSPMLLICFLSYTTFAIPPSDPQWRLLTLFTLFLVTVTFKMFVFEDLPRIPYLTHVDQYTLCCMSLMVCTCIWHSIVTLLYSHSSLPATAIVYIDRLVFASWFTFFIVLQVAFIFYYFFIVLSQYRRNLKLDKQVRKRWLHKGKYMD